MLFGSCQKDTPQLENSTNDKIKEIENALGVELKEASKEDLNNSFYIPYEELKKIIDSGEPFLSRSNDQNFDITRPVSFDFGFTVLKTKLYNIDLRCNNNVLRFNFKLTLERWDQKLWTLQSTINAAKLVANKEGSSTDISLIIKNLHSHIEINWDLHTSFDAMMQFNTIIDGKSVIFGVKFQTNVIVEFGREPLGINYPLDGKISFFFNF